MSCTLPIGTLIHERATELGLRPAELVGRAGYKNISKGLRRLSELYQGNFDSSRGLIRLLPYALELSPDDVRKAVQQSRRQIAEAEEARWRAAFLPHAIILTERTRPHPLHIAAMIGIGELKRVDFKPGSSPITYVRQASYGVQQKLQRWGHGQLPCFGRPIGIIINYTPDSSVKFDLNGKAIESFETAYCLGKSTLYIRCRATSPAGIVTLTVGTLKLFDGVPEKPSRAKAGLRS